MMGSDLGPVIGAVEPQPRIEKPYSMDEGCLLQPGVGLVLAATVAASILAVLTGIVAWMMLRGIV